VETDLQNVLQTVNDSVDRGTALVTRANNLLWFTTRTAKQQAADEIGRTLNDASEAIYGFLRKESET
jgi:hypothetical protein